MLALQELYDHARDQLEDEFDPDDVLFEFWRIEDDKLYFSVLELLPTCIPDISALDTEVPLGFRLAHSIFALEEAYDFDGWTALRNHHDNLPSTIAAYQRVGMQEEAAALSEVLKRLDLGEDDDEVLAEAFRSVVNPYRDDDLKRKTLRRFFRSNRNLFMPSAHATGSGG
jgi:hypothetical protein